MKDHTNLTNEGSSPSSPPEYAAAAIRAHVGRDLEPSLVSVHARLAASFIGGLALSLVVCGQFGLAFSAPAAAFSHQLHHNMDAALCAVICGALFSLFPVAILRLGLTSPLGFRLILRRHLVAVVFWYVLVGGVLGTFGHHGNDIVSVSLWIVTALATCWLLARAAFATLPLWNLYEVVFARRARMSRETF